MAQPPTTPGPAPHDADPTGTGVGVGELDEADAGRTLALATRWLLDRRAAEVEELRIAVHWATLHGEPTHPRDPMTQPGGEGTPPLREYAIPELAMARATHPATTRALIGDGLDLTHRLPRTWAATQALTGDPWVARRVAVLSRNLPPDRVAVVDRAVAAAFGGLGPTAVLELAAAKVIEADPEAHARRRDLERHRLYAALTRSDEFGFRKLVARTTSGAAARLDAMLETLATMLTPTQGHDHNHDELRAHALGLLADPADALRFLLEHTTSDHPAPQNPDHLDDPAPGQDTGPVPGQDTGRDTGRDTGQDTGRGAGVEARDVLDPEPDDDAAPVEGHHPDDTEPDDTEPDDTEPEDLEPDDTEPDDREPEPEPEPEDEAGSTRPVWAPEHLAATLDRFAALTPRQLAALRAKATVYVHLDATCLLAQSGLARVEGHGPLLLQALAELLDHTDVTLQPVIDLNAPVRLDRYEHPTRLKDHVWLLAGAESYPYAPRSTTRADVDFDHPTPYNDTGPPGQTGTHNSGPLRRRHHRWKTHGGYRCRQAGPGRYLWQTPHGTYHLVDHTGTHALDPDQALLILTAPAGLDIYPTTTLTLQDQLTA